MDLRKIILLLFAVMPGLLTGCGKQKPAPAENGQSKPPVAVELIVPAERNSGAGGTDVLLVPGEAVFHRGPLAGVYVVDGNGRISIRWISPGRLENGSLVVLGGLEAGERIVGTYDPRLEEGVRVKQLVSETKEGSVQ
ncbi:MAG: hypothetical protein FJZ79_06245 [Chlorobi bacterium]|nr:hypothetical protein [Chlorobiota bacterium]